MNEIKVIGKQEFMGKEISIIECEGGFGENQRIITAKEVAEIHEMKLGKINELINNNIDEFEIGIDIIDMKGNNEFAILAKDNELYTQNALNASSNIYILSEQGYIALVSLMKTDKAKQIRKQFRREYFAMREVIKSNDELLAQLCLQVYKGGQDALCASKQITEIEVAKATKPLLETIDNKNKTIQQQENEIIHKEDMIIDLTKGISIAEKRQRITQIIRYRAKGNYQERYNLLYREFNAKFHVDVQRRLKNGKENGTIKKSVNVMEYICSEKYLNMTNELYDLCIVVFEADFIELLDEWKDTINK